jgi:translation initiation factor IF-3
MPMAEYNKLSETTVLRVLADGTKTEMTLAEAVDEAEELDLDAVMVASNSKPLVVKLMDHGKERHERNMKQKAAVKKSQTTCTKELRLGLRIGQHDLEVKLRQAREFMEKGNRVKLFIQLRGAEFYNAQQQACEKIEEVAALLSNVGTRDGTATMLGKIASVVMLPGPPPKKPAAPKQQRASDGAGAGSAPPSPGPHGAGAPRPAPATGATPSADGKRQAAPAPPPPAARPAAEDPARVLRHAS